MVRSKFSSTTHALIGAGHMGGALLSGWIDESKAALKPEQILIIDPAPGEAAKKALDLGAKFSNRLTKGAASGLKICLLAIKPQLFAQLGPDLAKALPKDVLIISIMAGITLEKLDETLPLRPLIRAMPNAPCAYGMGITAYIGSENVTVQHIELAEICLKAGGKVVKLESERQIDMVTAVSGSGPAYVFYLTEALEAAGIKLGLPSGLARDLARQTVAGSGFMLEHSDKDAAELRRAVTSKGGTTQAALEVLMSEDGLASIMRTAVKAAYQRSRELGGHKSNT